MPKKKQDKLENYLQLCMIQGSNYIAVKRHQLQQDFGQEESQEHHLLHNLLTAKEKHDKSIQ